MLISIIIPALNEEAAIAEVLEHHLMLKGHFEVIVVDGGSLDKTVEIAKGFQNTKILKTYKGRAIQMNFGAQHASGDILLFLHADTFLPKNAYNCITDLCKTKKIIGGSFRLNMDDKHLIFKFYRWCSQFSLEFFTYGDHSIFVKADTFRKINGYKTISFMEDVEIQKRLRREGRFKKLNAFVTTSNRRFKENGVFSQLIIDILLVVLFKIGVSPNVLKKYYPDQL